MSGGGESTGLRATGTGTRLWIAAQVGLTALLAVLAVLVLTWLSERPGLRKRFDLTADAQNTLDLATTELLEDLQDDVTIDVFFRPLERPFTEIAAVVQERMFSLLLLVDETAMGKISLVNHDLLDPGRRSEVAVRARELNLGDPTNVVVVSLGDRRVTLALRGDIAELDGGNLDPNAFRPARIAAFRGEEALIGALLKVTQGERTKVLFSTGHGEPDLYGHEPGDLGALHTLLTDDGFAPAWWRGEEDGPLPDDCRVLAIIGPLQPFTEGEIAWIRAFLSAGGRLVAGAAPIGASGPTSLVALLREYGLRVGAGFVARPVMGPGGRPLFGLPECSQLVVLSSGMALRHPITEPLRKGGRRVVLQLCHPVERGAPPSPQGLVLPILASNEGTWLDLVDARGRPDWELDEDTEELGPFEVALATIFPPTEPVPGPRSIGGRTAPESRVVAIGSSQLFTDGWLPHNRDFVLNTFNWAASREFRATVVPRRSQPRILPLEGRALFHVNLAATWILPLLCLLAAVVTFLRRR